MGQVRGVQQRNGTSFARLAVPAELREALGGRVELRERLGSDRRQAEREIHAVLARFHDQLAQARKSNNPVVPFRKRPSSIQALARGFYAEELAYDDCERMADAKLGMPDPDPSFALGILRS